MSLDWAASRKAALPDDLDYLMHESTAIDEVTTRLIQYYQKTLLQSYFPYNGSEDVYSPW